MGGGEGVGERSEGADKGGEEGGRREVHRGGLSRELAGRRSIGLRNPF